MEYITREDLFRLLGAFLFAESLLSPNGNEVANQFKLHFKNGEAFQSYQSLIAVKHDGVLYLTDEHDYSRTTSKYATLWTGKDTKTRRDELKKGIAVSII